MKLIYNLEDKLFYIQNFLPNHEYKRIHNEIFKEAKKLKYLENASKTWNKQLLNNLETPKRVEINENYFKFYKTLLLHQPFIKIKNFYKSFKFLIHIMGKNSGINWHGDDGHEYSITYYLNKRWNKNWGGEFMFTHNGQNGYIPVIGNSVVIIKTPLQHKVNSVLTNIISRITIQSFIK
jgi:Rps23 Pro-64 3,4-dihydroxylase Tpa1-like proline 4-hydroxylase